MAFAISVGQSGRVAAFEPQSIMSQVSPMLSHSSG